MSSKIEVLGLKLDYLNVDSEMERLTEFIHNDRLDSIGIITMNTLLLAEKEDTWRTYLENLDMSVIGEKEVLEAVGITSGQIYDEVADNEFPAPDVLVYDQPGSWHVFAGGESGGSGGTEKISYPGLHPRPFEGMAADVAGVDMSVDSIINEINSISPDVIISGLQGIRQDQFLMANRQKIGARIWLGLGEHPELQNEAGLKVGWWSTLLKKTTFKRLVSKSLEEKKE